MTGYMYVIGPCFGCKRPFSFNPDKVPSIRVNAAGQADPAGDREPICAECVARANPLRAQNGLLPIHVPEGAYDPQEVL